MPSRSRTFGRASSAEGGGWSTLDFFESGVLSSGVSDSAKDKVLRGMDLAGASVYDLISLQREVEALNLNLNLHLSIAWARG